MALASASESTQNHGSLSELPYLARSYIRLDVDAFFEDLATIENEEEQHEILRQGIMADPFVLARIIWPDYEFHHDGFHREYLENAIYNQKSLTLGPRDSAKSTVVVTLLSTWAIIKDRNVTIAVLTQAEDASKDFVQEVQDALEDPCIVRLFGKFKSSQWTTERFNVEGRTRKGRNRTLSAYGWGSKKFTGKHTDLIFGDDMVGNEHHDSAHVRRKFANWIGMCLDGVASAHTQLAFAGTRYHPDDYYGQMITDGFAVNSERTRQAFDWAKFENDMDALTQADLLWSERMTVEDMKYKARNVYTFKLQFLNRVDGLDGLIFKKAWFAEFDFQHFNAAHVVIGVDTAYKTASKNDYSAVVAMGRVNTGQFIVLDARHGHWSSQELKAEIYAMYQRYAAKQIIVEEFARAKSENANRFFLLQELRTYQLPSGHTVALPAKSVRPDKDKVARYHEIAPFYECGMVWHRPGLTALQNEMLGLPNGENDDMADALWIAFNELNRGGKPVYRESAIRY